MRALFASSRLLLLSVVLAVCCGMLVAWQLLQSREAEWQDAERTGNNLLFTVSFVLERTLDRANRAIVHTAGQLADRDAAQATDILLSDDTLFHMLPDDALGVLLVTDADGRVLRSARPVTAEVADLSDREFFRVHRDDPGRGLFISAPFLSRLDARPSLALSRRWSYPDGRFGGVVVQTVKLDVLQTLFDAIRLGPGSTLNLFMDDGTLLMRVPHNPELLGISLRGTPNVDYFLRMGDGSHVGTAAIDGVQRLYVFRRLRGFPMVVNVAQSTETVLANWRRSAGWQAFMTALLMLGILGLASMAQRELNAHRAVSTRLRRVQRELRTIMDHTPALIAHWGRDLTNRFANQVHEHWLGPRGALLAGRHVRSLIGEKGLRRLQPHIDAVLEGRAQTFETAYLDRNDTLRHASCNLVPDRDADGRIDGFFSLLHDVSDYKQAEERLAEEKERFRVTLESIRDGVITTDAHGRVDYQNPAAGAMTGWPPYAVFGLPVADVVVLKPVPGPRENAVQRPSPVAEALADPAATMPKRRYVLIGRDGQHTDVEVWAACILDNGQALAGCVMVLHDVTMARSQADQMARLALHDSLTGLPNRRFLNEMAEQSMADARRSKRRLALLYLDLDGFKHVNDTYGHAAGDALLVRIARNWRAQLRGGDVLARIGGDEFVVLMNHVRDRQEAAQLARRLLTVEQSMPQAGGGTAIVTTSMGIGFWPDDAQEFDTLIARTDEAMYRAKLLGSNQYCFIID